MKKISIIVCLLLSLALHAQQWSSMLAYNNVTQIALGSDCVYALSDGSLFIVDKQTEQVKVYDARAGLHSTGICCISYDKRLNQLIIAYTSGKIDILSSKGVQYVGGLYDKDMTQKKTIYNITIHNRTAYFSTHYGVQTFDLQTNTLVDTYWLRPNGKETKIDDVLIQNDSIYAFSGDSLFCAAMSANLVDYTVWKREPRTGRINPEPEKGIHYQDGVDHWYAGGADGLTHITPTEHLNYKPQGPLVNMPYTLATSADYLFVLPGGRWAAQNNTPGVVMRYNGSQWMNISADSIQAVTNNPALDFMNVAVDPQDQEHYFVTSYGTGLYEFRGNTLIRQILPAEDNTLGPAVVGALTTYTRLNCAVFDRDRNLWLMNAGDVSYPLVCLDNTGGWHGFKVTVNNTAQVIHTPSGLIWDNQNANYLWFAAARAGTCLYLLDTNGTPFDTSDDRLCARTTWIDQNNNTFAPAEIRAIMQDTQGRLWVATEQGMAYIDNVDFFTSERIVVPDVMDNNGENPFPSKRIMALAEDKDGHIWIGTQSSGVYVLSAQADEIIAQYTTDNSSMPSNSVLSLARDVQGVMYVGTGDGLVACDPKAKPDATDDFNEGANDVDLGSMQQWKLHYSYAHPQEMAVSPEHVYALAEGALFSANRKTDEVEYWNKSTGLNGGAIAHMAYDKNADKLLVGYQDGRIDLLEDNGSVIQMPDLYIKAASVAVTINQIYAGSKHAYLAMPFGIITLNTKKAEIVDTYYVGQNASAVDVKQIVELSDSLFAFSDNAMYAAALKDNLVDFSFWHQSSLPTSGLQQALVHNNEIYVLQDSVLYRRHNNQWQQVLTDKLDWINSSNGQLLAHKCDVNGFYRIEEEGAILLHPYFNPKNAVVLQGDYWLAIETIGLIRWNSQEEQRFYAEGPMNNFGYRLCAAHGQIYVAPGGRWASQFLRPADLSIYNGISWKGISRWDTNARLFRNMLDAVSFAVDPQDAGHFFVATYGTGVFEYRNYEAVKHYGVENSTLAITAEGLDPNLYTRTEGAIMDKEGNLWVLNATNIGNPVHILTPSGQWYSLPLYAGGNKLQFTTPGEIWMDRRNSSYKWMYDQRNESGVILFYDGGTPTRPSDDRCVKRSSFVDQNGNTIIPGNIMCLTQDLDNRIWIGTTSGILVIPSSVDFMTSNECHRIIIPRNDGTGLGDYLLGNEQINCLAVDGGNRMWIGTAGSGLYLIEDDTITVAHFTEWNSSLPSNNIQSIAIEPQTGEVFVGTANGIASYRSDANEAQDDFSGAYAFPNPVPSNYGGVISITGLMDNTVVNIIDAGGNLVCKTKSHGGMAVWDGKDAYGKRATPGIYTAMCNEPSGKHTVVKILVIR